MLIPNKREFLARALAGVGAVRLLEWAGGRPSVLVATYHRIGRPEEDPYYEGVFSASPAAFRAQVLQLRDRFRMIGLDELLAVDGSGAPAGGPAALITFDDGYRDNFDVAFPILEELGVPATFFIPTGFFRAPRLPWWDHAAFVLKRTSATRIVLDDPCPLSIDLARETRAEAIAKVVAPYLDGKVADESRARAHLEDRAGVSVDDEAAGRDLFMTWDQVRRLADSGMAIGSHSHGHPRLAALSEPDQRLELSESRRILEQELGREVRALAYPFGWPGTYDDLTRRLAREEGYRIAFSSSPGLNRPGSWDPFALRRLNVGFHDSPPLLRARTALQSAFGASFL